MRNCILHNLIFGWLVNGLMMHLKLTGWLIAMTAFCYWFIYFLLLLFFTSQTQGRESIAAKLVANLITKAGADRVLACDLHSGQSMGYFDISVDHVHCQVSHL